MTSGSRDSSSQCVRGVRYGHGHGRGRGREQARVKGAGYDG